MIYWVSNEQPHRKKSEKHLLNYPKKWLLFISFYNILFLNIKYHPDSNSADKTLHEKFVKINEAFSILSKQSTRTTYDQSIGREEKVNWKEIFVILALDSTSYSRRYSSSAPPRQQTTGSPFDWTSTNFDNRRTYQQRSNTNESDW